MINQAFINDAKAVIDDISDEDFELAEQCMKRAAAMLAIDDRVGLLLDILATHKQLNLDLQALLKTDDGNFSHDIVGIYNNFDRETKTMQNLFCPRFALNQI